MSDAVLVLNAGSSSVKFALFDLTLRRLVHGQCADIGGTPHLLARDGQGVLAELAWPGLDYQSCLEALLGWIGKKLGPNRLVAAGHRIVHGGPHFTEPVRLDDASLAALDQLAPLAPLHQSHNLAAVRMLQRINADIAQIGCFDTAFHATMSATARRFAIPRALEADGIRRYGFHGLSYEHVADRLRSLGGPTAGGRIVAAHLGNGASLCAIRNGASMDTSMGLTALDGLVMATRPGALDPGVVLYLLGKGMPADRVEDLLYKRCGLLGVSGISGDMRVLLQSVDPLAREAIDLFAFRAARDIGAMAASLGGVDGLVFTGGIGENSAPIRREICERSAWLGVRLDYVANQANADQIAAPDSRIPVWVIPADEELVVARHTLALLG